MIRLRAKLVRKGSIRVLTVLSMAASSLLLAGTIEPELQEAIEGLDGGDLVDVIVRCNDPVDPRTLRNGDRQVRREQLIRALRARSEACFGSLSRWLETTAQGPVVELWGINGIAARLPVSEINGVAQRPAVKSVGLDARLGLPGPVTSRAAPPRSIAIGGGLPEWNVEAIRAPELWGLGHDATGILVATMDTGVDVNHPAIGPSWRGGGNSWFDPSGEHATPYDSNGHGTWSMGILLGGDAGGTAIGVAPGARWIAVKIFQDNDATQLSLIHEGFQWLLDPDGDPATDDAPDVVNNSWYLDGTTDLCDGEFSADIAALEAAGIAAVFAAGNTGPDPATSVSPSNDPRVVAVGAVDAYGNVAEFSGRGPSTCDGGIYPGISAPGVDLRTADLSFGGLFPDSYITVSGTSFAAPHVAGGIALLMGAFTEASPSQINSAMEAGARDLAAAGPDNDTGLGHLDLVDAYAWLESNIGSPLPGELQFSAADYAVDESAGGLTVTVTRVAGSAGEVTVDYTAMDGAATAGNDYESLSGTLTFLDGETSLTFDLSIVDDALHEGDEDLTLMLGNLTGGAALGTPSTAVVTIHDDDPPQPGTLQFSSPSYSVAEDGGAVSITVTRTGGSDGPVAVQYATGRGSASANLDYAPTGGTLSFADGQTANAFSVTILDDADDEADENFGLALGSPTGGASLGSPGRARVTILDQDPPPVPDDQDGDGYLAGAGGDCNDGDPTVHPGAAEIKHDGVDQDCNGYDLTIDVLAAQYSARADLLSVKATSDLRAGASLSVDGLGAMTWNRKTASWVIYARGVGGNPGTVTVTGVEGSETAVVSNQ